MIDLEQRSYPVVSLEKLKVLAEAASKGGDHIHRHWLSSQNWSANHRWLVAASPESFLAIAIEVAALREAHDGLLNEVQRQVELRRLQWGNTEQLRVQVAALQVELEALKGKGEGAP